MKMNVTQIIEKAIKVFALCALFVTLGIFMVNPAFAQEAATVSQTTASQQVEADNSAAVQEEIIADDSTPASSAQDARAAVETGATTGRNAGTTALFVFGIAVAAFIVTAASVTMATRKKK